MTAREIYNKAVAEAYRDHEAMTADFVAGRIEIATPCGMDREREYIIAAFAKALGETE